MDTRLNLLKNWLINTYDGQVNDIKTASADASFRRYFRVSVTPANSTNKCTLIAMDAPPDKEDCEPFIQIANLLSKQGVHTPDIINQDTELGFLLLEDLGNTDYLSKLASLDTANRLYSDAIKSLIKIQTGPIESVSPYSEEKLRNEMSLFPEWFLKRHLNINLRQAQVDVWENTQQLLCRVCFEQPQVWVHRDYHSRNLMVTKTNNPGVIDFQDLLAGPISYDLASLFKDCYIQWPRVQQMVWLHEYLNAVNTSPFALTLEEQLTFDQLVRWYDLTGLQRHLKVLGIFCRLNYRDDKPQYLNDLPLVAKYCLEVLTLYPELAEFQNEFRTVIEQVL